MSKKKKPQVEQVECKEEKPQVPDNILIRNNLNQLVAFNIKKPDGSLIGVQIDANSSLVWKKLPDYGPDTDRLIKRKVLRLEIDK
jgi:hypothetical protein